jgi:5-methyltetrahydropteroyltriglutamate--homocysteine methyltransferase
MSVPRPFRAEHVGSFPRPPALMQARAQFATGGISAGALRQAEDTAIRPVIAMQERVGIDALTDGEFRRASWRDAPFEHLDGFSKQRSEADFTFRLFDGSTRKAGPVPSVVGKIKRRTPMTADHFSLLTAMTKRPVKANLPTPSVTFFFAAGPRLTLAFTLTSMRYLPTSPAPIAKRWPTSPRAAVPICKWTRCRSP